MSQGTMRHLRKMIAVSRSATHTNIIPLVTKDSALINTLDTHGVVSRHSTWQDYIVT